MDGVELFGFFVFFFCNCCVFGGVGSFSFFKGFGFFSVVFCGYVVYLGFICGVVGDVDFGFIDIVESVGM